MTPKRTSAEKPGTDYIPTPAVSVVSTELDGEAVLFDESTKTVHVLNPSATALWLCFDGSATVDEIATDLADVSGLGFRAARGQVAELVRELENAGLLVSPSRPKRHSDG